MSNVSRTALNALLPDGAFWEVEPGSDYDNLYDGVASNQEEVRQFLAFLSKIRNPLKTTILSDLEKEFGLNPLDTATEEERRQSLLTTKTSNDGNGSNDFVETQLRDAGFDVYVHDNNPPVDPDIFLEQNFRMVANGPAAFAGNDEALAGEIGGELLVNGAQYTQEPAYIMQANGSIAYAGNDDAIAGRYDALSRIPVEYTVPADSGYWGLIFFVGGQATRDPITGEITAIASAEVPVARRSELRTLILRFKPLHSWCALIVNYV
jgi:hypothetical protein